MIFLNTLCFEQLFFCKFPGEKSCGQFLSSNQYINVDGKALNILLKKCDN